MDERVEGLTLRPTIDLPSMAEFRRLTKEQLILLAKVDEVANLVKELFDLEAHWPEEKEREERERTERLEESERRYQLELEKLKWENRGVAAPAFDLSSAERLLPQFDPEGVDVFFESFERMAKE